MDEQGVLKQLGEIVAEVLELDGLELTMETTAEQVEGWDSIATVEIMVAVEDAFGIRLKTGEMAAMSCVGDLVERVAARTAR